METMTSVHNILQENYIDALLLSSTPMIVYLTNYAGFSSVEREAYILITKQHAYLFTDARYSEAVRQQISYVSLQEISGQSPFTTLLQTLIIKENISVLGFESVNLTVAEYTNIKKHVSAKLKPILLRDLRIKKTKAEISTIKTACEIGDKTFSHIRSFIEVGMTEQDVALEMEIFIRKHDAELSFPTIVAFGKNAAIPHHHTGQTPLKKQDVILLDFGVNYDNYCSDMTRTIFIGKMTKEQKRIYETVRNAQQQAIQYIEKKLQRRSNNNIQASEVDTVARNYIISKGYPSIPHSLGHGIGIEVHEAPTLSPRSKDILKEGMVFSIEPGIYLPSFTGVRIEDLFTIQNSKIIPLTNSPKDLIVL